MSTDKPGNKPKMLQKDSKFFLKEIFKIFKKY